MDHFNIDVVVIFDVVVRSPARGILVTGNTFLLALRACCHPGLDWKGLFVLHIDPPQQQASLSCMHHSCNKHWGHHLCTLKVAEHIKRLYFDQLWSNCVAPPISQVVNRHLHITEITLEGLTRIVAHSVLLKFEAKVRNEP